MDAPGRTFRDELYAAVQGQPRGDARRLRAQIEPMLRSSSALGFPILRVEGVEADDVIGTLALQAPQPAWT